MNRSSHLPAAIVCSGKPGTACSTVKYARPDAVEPDSSSATFVVTCFVRGVPSSYTITDSCNIRSTSAAPRSTPLLPTNVPSANNSPTPAKSPASTSAA